MCLKLCPQSDMKLPNFISDIHLSFICQVYRYVSDSPSRTKLCVLHPDMCQIHNLSQEEVMTYKDGLSATSSQLSSQSARRQPSQQMHSTQTLLKLVACRQIDTGSLPDTNSDSETLTDKQVHRHRHTGRLKLTGSGKN